MSNSSGPVPDSINQLGEQLQEFRSTHPRGTRLPEVLWQRAVEQARQHGIYMVAHTLRLDYTNLQKRLGGAAAPGTNPRQWRYKLAHRDNEKLPPATAGAHRRHLWNW